MKLTEYQQEIVEIITAWVCEDMTDPEEFIAKRIPCKHENKSYCTCGNCAGTGCLECRWSGVDGVVCPDCEAEL